MFSLKPINEVSQVFSKIGKTRPFVQVLIQAPGSLPEHYCYVEYWSNYSCALSSIQGLCYGFDQNFPAFVEWLKTQPQTNSTEMTWEAKIFTILPAHKNGENIRKLTTEIATFPNYAHGKHPLSLYLLDLTKV